MLEGSCFMTMDLSDCPFGVVNPRGLHHLSLL